MAERNGIDHLMMRLAMNGVFHGTTVHSRNIFEHFIKHGSKQARNTAHAGMALLAMASASPEAALQIIDMLDDTSSEVVSIRALIYKFAKNGHADALLEKLDGMGQDAAEMAAEIRKLH